MNVKMFTVKEAIEMNYNEMCELITEEQARRILEMGYSLESFYDAYTNGAFVFKSEGAEDNEEYISLEEYICTEEAFRDKEYKQ